MQVKVFENDANVDLNSACSLTMHSKSFLARKEHVFELKYWSDAKKVSCHLAQGTLGSRGPALDLHAVLARLEGNDSNAVACNRVAAMAVSLPDLNRDLGPTSHRLTLIV